MAAPSSEQPTWRRRRAGVIGALGIVAVTLALVAGALLGGDDERVAVRSGGDPSGDAPAQVGDGDRMATSTTAPRSEPTSTTAPPATTTTAPSTTTAAAPTTTQSPAPPAPSEVSTTTAPAPTTGTLALELAPPAQGWSKDVWVEGPGGTTVLPPTPVTGSIVIEGLVPGTYEVFVSEQGPPYGPDENGVELGGASQVVRTLADVAAGGTTTVDDPSV